MGRYLGSNLPGREKKVWAGSLAMGRSRGPERGRFSRAGRAYSYKI